MNQPRHGTRFLGPAALAAALLFAWLAWCVRPGHSVAFDTTVRATVHSWASPALTEAMRFVTDLGSHYFLVPLGVLLVWRWVAIGRRRQALLFASAILSAELFTQLFKLVFHRPRPEVFFGLAPAETNSYPSGHAFASTVFYGLLAALLSAGETSARKRRAIRIAGMFLPLAIGFSRVYLGFHYPSDVLGGYAAAVVWLWAGRWLSVARLTPPEST
ncbi:MAG TPA: phosphatase PAP2 family protein [Bryobacteraceae bacterium]|nr:phosphatase PAP2 family protein [Bryobacteraceae bacterium]